MAAYRVQLYGLPNDLASLRQVELQLEGGVTLGDVVAALRRNIPALEGRVIRSGENKLASHYVFNVNGRFHVDEYDTQVRPDDRILIVTFALGG